MKLLNYCVVKDTFHDKKSDSDIEYETYYLIVKDKNGFQNVAKMKAKYMPEKDIKGLVGKEIDAYYTLNPYNQKYQLEHISEKVDESSFDLS